MQKNIKLQLVTSKMKTQLFAPANLIQGTGVLTN